MEVAIKQSQEPMANAGNLWHWLTEGAINIVNPPDSFKPEIMKWMSSSDTGFVRKCDSSKCKFTNSSVSARRTFGYQANVFLELKPGKYVMSYKCDSQHQLIFDKYVIQDNGLVKFGSSTTHVYANSGNNVVEFEIPDYILMMLHFIGLPEETQWATFTDIVIREGVL